MNEEEIKSESESGGMTEEEKILNELEPGDRKEEFSPFDWCMAAGCGCGGCLDPTGCLDLLSQGCLGCLEACLGRIGCGVIVLGMIIWLISAAII